MGRPYDRVGPPIVLFHDGFGQFLEDFTNRNLDINYQMYIDSQKFMATASQFFSDESSRNFAMERELARIVDEPLALLSYGNNNRADGVWSTSIHDQMAYRFIMEVKNELGGTQAEPTLQASLYYFGYWSQMQVCGIQ